MLNVFISIVLFGGINLSMPMKVLISALYYAYSMLKIIESPISCHDNDLITTSVEPTRMHHSKN